MNKTYTTFSKLFENETEPDEQIEQSKKINDNLLEIREYLKKIRTQTSLAKPQFSNVLTSIEKLISHILSNIPYIDDNEMKDEIMNKTEELYKEILSDFQKQTKKESKEETNQTEQIQQF